MISVRKAHAAADELLAHEQALAREAANRRARGVSFIYQSKALRALSRSEQEKALVRAERSVVRHKGFVAGCIVTACAIVLLGFALLSSGAAYRFSLLLALPVPMLVLSVRTALVRQEISRLLAAGQAAASKGTSGI
jgi:hypothetical protein